MRTTQGPAAEANSRNQSGAFDLPSVLIGVAVVAILAIGVMAAVFGVIPWAQDRAAKQDLAALGTAQGAAYAHGGSFAGKAALVRDGWLGMDTPGALQAKAGADGKCYVAVTTAKTGNKFIASNDQPTPRELKASDSWCNGSTVLPDTTPVMVTRWDTGLSENCKEITLPVTGFKGAVNWGDGTTDASLKHTFAGSGEVTIRMDGTFSAWGSLSWTDSVCLISVERWGSTETTNLSAAFHNADNLTHVASIPPSTTNMSSAFQNVDSDFTLGTLDTSKVTDMTGMFNKATRFNSPVDFDTSSVTGMSGMFAYAQAFNQRVDFDTSKVTSMSSMFISAKDFNQPVPFDTSKVVNLASMFDLTVAFNQPLNFDTSSATNTAAMFSSAKGFNQPIDFDTSKVTNMYAMFQHASAFNQPVKLKTGNVENMSHMFSAAASFNQPLDFDTGKVTDMTSMLNAAPLFNQDLSGWNVKAVTSYVTFAGANMPASKLPKFGVK